MTENLKLIELSKGTFVNPLSVRNVVITKDNFVSIGLGNNSLSIYGQLIEAVLWKLTGDRKYLEPVKVEVKAHCNDELKNDTGDVYGVITKRGTCTYHHGYALDGSPETSTSECMFIEYKTGYGYGNEWAEEGGMDTIRNPVVIDKTRKLTEAELRNQEKARLKKEIAAEKAAEEAAHERLKMGSGY